MVTRLAPTIAQAACDCARSSPTRDAPNLHNASGLHCITAVSFPSPCATRSTCPPSGHVHVASRIGGSHGYCNKCGKHHENRNNSRDDDRKDRRDTSRRRGNGGKDGSQRDEELDALQASVDKAKDPKIKAELVAMTQQKKKQNYAARPLAVQNEKTTELLGRIHGRIDKLRDQRADIDMQIKAEEADASQIHADLDQIKADLKAELEAPPPRSVQYDPYSEEDEHMPEGP